MCAVSQTGGPETVLCGELELPFALVGFVTDYANEVVPGEPTPVTTLFELLGRSTGVFAALLREALPRIAALDPPPAAAGTVFRFGQIGGGRELMARLWGRRERRRAAADASTASLPGGADHGAGAAPR